MKTIALILWIFLAIWQGIIVFGNLFMRQDVPASDIFLLAFASTWIVTYCIGIW